MKTILFAILQVILASGILYAYYHLMLRNNKFHQYNRFYLLAIVVISLLIPFLNIPVYFSNEETGPARVFQTLNSISPTGFEESATPVIVADNSARKMTSFTREDVIYLFYLLITVMLLLKILLSVRKIRVISATYPSEKIGNINFVNTNEPGTPFSFFRWLFWNRNIELDSDNGQQIFRHELFHINQRHSADVVFLEVINALAWFNPFFYLIKKEVKAIHEFLADEYAMNKAGNWEYAELLLMQALNTKHHLVNPFFHNQIKRRIAMITNPKKTSHRYLRKLLVLPVATLVLILFAFKYKHRNTESIEKCNQAATVVIDAAHGGIDPGAKSADGKYSEAQLALEIAKEIQVLSKEYNVKVVMTRDGDILPGNATNKADGLRKRIEICEETNPDVFVSLHMNAATENLIGNKGFEAYIAGKRESDASRKFAETILQNVSSVYLTNEQPKQRHEAGVYVLDKNNYPAVILQCGYITNSADLAFIKKPENREKLARSILEAVVKYKNEPPGKIDPANTDTLPHGSKPSTEKILEKVEIEPAFPGGKAAWKKYLERNLDAEIPAKNHASSGTYTVFVQFVVRMDGKISDIKALTNHGFGMEDEVVRLIKKGPVWSPAMQNGQKVNAYRKQPVTFVVGFVAGDGSSTPGTTSSNTRNNLNEVVVVGFSSPVYEKVDIEPSFPGGEIEWEKYLAKNLNTPVAEKNNAPAGEYSVYVQFVVHTDGYITDIKPLTNHGFGMEEEAIRVIKKGPTWYPAMQDGKKVNAYKKQRIDFIAGKPKVTTQIIPLEKVRSIEQGKTSLSQIQSLFGEPKAKQIEKNTIIWTYEAYLSRLDIQFGRSDETTINFRFTAITNTKKENIDYEKAKTIKENETSLEQLEKLFGQPYQIEINNNDENWTYEGFDSRLSVMSKARGKGIISSLLYNSFAANGESKSTGKADDPLIINASNKDYYISIKDLQKATPYDLLRLEKGAEIFQFSFGIESPKGDINEEMNIGSEFNKKTKKLIDGAQAGKQFFLENIIVVKDGSKKKLPAILYHITD